MDQTKRAYGCDRHSSRLCAHGCLKSRRPHETGRNKHVRRLFAAARGSLGGHALANFWRMIFFQTMPASQVLYQSAMSVMSIAFELRALALYRRHTAAARQKYRNDFLLLSKDEKSLTNRDTTLLEKAKGNPMDLSYSRQLLHFIFAAQLWTYS